MVLNSLPAVVAAAHPQSDPHQFHAFVATLTESSAAAYRSTAGWIVQRVRAETPADSRIVALAEGPDGTHIATVEGLRRDGDIVESSLKLRRGGLPGGSIDSGLSSDRVRRAGSAYCSEHFRVNDSFGVHRRSRSLPVVPLLWLLATGRFLRWTTCAFTSHPFPVLGSAGLRDVVLLDAGTGVRLLPPRRGPEWGSASSPSGPVSRAPAYARVNLELIFNYAFALIGARLMLGRFGMTPAAAWFGAMSFAFSEFNRCTCSTSTPSRWRHTCHG